MTHSFTRYLLLAACSFVGLTPLAAQRLSTLPASSHARPTTTVTEAWTARYNGPGNGADEVGEMTVDAAGNVYVTGRSLALEPDYATIKYSPSGQQLWVAYYEGGDLYVGATDIAVDAVGNVYVTGQSNGQIKTIKYSPSGQRLWVVGTTLTGTTTPTDLTVDAVGNVYVVGQIKDPTVDYVVVKYSASGQQLWLARYDGPANLIDSASAVAVDAEGNVYVSGNSQPSNGLRDYTTLKYSATGQQLWVARYNGPGNQLDSVADMVLDAAGNVYVTGGSASGSNTGTDYATVKYSTTGQQLWVARYNGPKYDEDDARAVAVDAAGNVYVTGMSSTISSSGDYVTIKYSPTGQQLWEAQYNGPVNGGDAPTDLVLDTTGAVYVTGISLSGSGPIGTGRVDFATVKYTPDGQQEWVARLVGSTNGSARPMNMAVDPSGNVYVAGNSTPSTMSRTDFLTVKYTQNTPVTTEVSSTTPTRNANAAPLGTNVALTYSKTLNQATAGTVRVFSSQAGGRKNATITASGNTLTVDPTTNFLPGEVVFVSAPGTVLASDGTPGQPYVYQFTTQAGAGPLTFAGPDLDMGPQSVDVVTADVNNDGRLDLLVVNSTTNQVSVRLGDGQGRFSSTGTLPIQIGNTPRSLIAADMNADGNLDFLTANTGNNTVSVRLGNGQGGFFAAPDVAVGTNLASVVAADLNGDGNLDVLTLHNDGTSGTVNVRLSDGQGRFVAAPNVPVGVAPTSLVAADLNNDGFLDLLTGSGRDEVRVRLGDGQGNFQVMPDVTAALMPVKVLAVDVNGDGNLDILTANVTNTTVSIRLGDGQGRFTGTNNIYVGDQPVDIATGDMNGDGLLDLLAANTLEQTVTVLLGNGQGGFTLAATVPVDDRITGVRTVDLDGDGDLDILATIAASSNRNSKISVRLNQAAPTLTSFSPASGPVGAQVVLTGTGFSGVESVAFNGIVAPNFVVNSSTQITAVVPAGAMTGRIVVATLAGRATSVTSFQVTQAPVVTTTAGLTTAPEQVTTAVDAGLTVTDANNATLVSATVSISLNFQSAEDELAFSNTDVAAFGSIGSATSTSGTLTLVASGTPATVAQWQAALRSVTYRNSSATPSTTARTVSFAVDNGLLSSVPATKVIQVQVVNGAPSIPVDADPAANTVAERAAPGTSVGITVAAIDIDGPTLTYSLINDAGGRFTVNSSTGVVTVANGTLLDYATTTSHVITAQASDGTLTSSQRFTIQVTPVNRAPVIANQTFTVADNSPSGLLVGTIVASDPDAGQTVTYALLGSNTTGPFTLVDNELRVLNPAALLSSPTSTFSLSVRVTDNGMPSLAATALVTVQLIRVSCTAPVLMPPVDQRVVATSGQCSASVIFAATATGSPAPTLRYTIGTTPITSPYAFPVGTTSVTVTATNTCGTTTESFTVTVEDRQAPTLRAAGFITAIESNGVRTIEAADVDWGSFDECSGIASMRISPRTFTCANIGPNQVTLTVTDNAGNSASETVTVILVDNSAPVLVAAGFETTLVNGTRTIEASDIDYGSYDACGSIASMRISPRTFTCANVGPNPVTLIVTDNSGNVSSQTVTVLIQADATCPAASAAQSKPADPSVARGKEQNQLTIYPNPAQEQATLRFQAVQTGPAQVQVYNTVGRLVATLYEGVVEQGHVYERTLSGTSLPAGLYTCRFTQQGQSISQRLVLSK